MNNFNYKKVSNFALEQNKLIYAGGVAVLTVESNEPMIH